MRVGLNARTLATNQLRGWSRYTANLIKELSHLSVPMCLFSDRKINEKWLDGARWDRLDIEVIEGKNYFHWEQWVLPHLARKAAVDILHCPIHFGLPAIGEFKKVITLHDAIEKSYYDKKYSLKELLSPKRVYSRGLNRNSRMSADLIFTVSEYSRQDLHRFYKIPLEKIKVTYPAADSKFCQSQTGSSEELHKKLSIKQPYLFYVGGLEDRKNIEFLLRTFASLDAYGVELVIGGGAPKEIEVLKNKYPPGNRKNPIRFLGYVEDQDLPMLYAHALAMVYPSLYEGFGLQVVEAMKMGCPVLVSDRSSLPEVLGNSEALFDPLREESLKVQLERVIQDTTFIGSLRKHSLIRAEQFSWQKMAQDSLTYYQELVNNP